MIPNTPTELSQSRETASTSGDSRETLRPGSGFDWAFFSYATFASLLVGLVAIGFFSQLRLQLFLSSAQRGLSLPEGVWSAPLDDTFIHFDFARSLARGFPFQWVEGNGYSSGGTSLLYPFVLALGYWLGFKQTSLMLWAGVVACISTLIVLLVGRRLFSLAKLPSYTAYFLPPIFLSIGALDWSLFSGMEVAFFLAVWAGCFQLWLTAEAAHTAPLQRALPLGLGCAALVATRPEAVCLVVVFALALALPGLRQRGFRQSASLLCISSVPAVLVVLAQTIANRVFTGEWSAAGALVKLEANHPYLSTKEVWGSWGFHIKYQALRITNYHFAAPIRLGSVEIQHLGWLWWGFALLPLLKRETRKLSLFLWASILAWVLMVALNGQVRWQNERYTMPAVAWFLICSSLGVSLLVAEASNRRNTVLKRSLVGAATLLGLSAVLFAQYPRFCEQLWFFGRASRNIHDQQVTAAALLGSREPRPRRVLVGDAGAIPYISELPALDLIGLGGYHDLPFARASRLGVAAAIELIGRLPPSDRPDVLAVYPGWWGDFVHWFGVREAGVSVRGNVICGGPTKVIYRANWAPLENSERPFSSLKDSSVIDALDVADLVSEREHRQRLTGTPGFVAMKMLPNPAEPRQDLWDAGRALPPAARLSFEFDPNLATTPSTQLDLILRLAPTGNGTLVLRVDGRELPPLVLSPTNAWEEHRIPLPVSHETEKLAIEIEARGAEAVLYHVWVVERP